MKRRIGLAIICLLTVILLSACSTKEEKTALVVAMELDYPPFEAIDTNGTPYGVSVDMAEALGQYSGREIKIVNLPWEELIPALQEGRADLIISSMGIIPERTQLMDFSDPYANAALAILANKNSGITNIDDLDMPGKIVATKKGSSGYFYAKKHFKDTTIHSLSKERECVEEVAQGKADAFIYDQLSVYRDWREHKGATKAILIPFDKPELWAIAVKKGNTELLAEVNDFLAVYRKSGGFDQVTEKYLSHEKNAFDKLGLQWFFDFQ